MKNGVMMQYFEWYLPDDGEHWNRLKADAQHLAQKGVTAVWIPPACKGTGSNDVGYGVYDLYDLGEYDQKGTVRTKYGTKDTLIQAIASLHEAGIQVYGDCVLNHKAGADYTELFSAVKVNPDNREEAISEPYDIEAWTGFDFPGRQDRSMSDFKWHFYHFTGVDYDAKADEKGIFRIVGEGKHWSTDVSSEHGNFDYLMNADIDHDHPEVAEELIHWGHWFCRTLQLDGLRMDAVKHISAGFMQQFAEAMRREFGDSFYMVGEYWQGDTAETGHYMAEIDYEMDLFDVALHFNFMRASKEGEAYDLRTLFDHTVVQENPTHAVTFVDNHDSQPGQSLESSVQDWFKPAAYALILLRKSGYPCVFYGDYYGTADGKIASHKDVLDRLFELRRTYAYGDQVDYFEQPQTIGWVRLGTSEHPHAMAVIVTTSTQAESQYMLLGDLYQGRTFYDYLGHCAETITLDEKGGADFPVNPGSVSCWVSQDGEGMPH